MWACTVCYLDNQDTAAFCAACHAPAPAARAPEKWQVVCPVCGARYPVSSVMARIERCDSCEDMFDQFRIASCAPEPVASAETPKQPAKPVAQDALLLRPARRPPGQGALDIHVPGEAILGRQGDCQPGEFCFSGLVGRRHCRVWRAGDGWMIEDLSSTCGTFVNGRRLPPNAPLALPDRFFLQLGDLCFNASAVKILAEGAAP